MRTSPGSFWNCCARNEPDEKDSSEEMDDFEGDFLRR